jgi:hypothetical protein
MGKTDWKNCHFHYQFFYLNDFIPGTKMLPSLKEIALRQEHEAKKGYSA